jgi:hypothetical protein
MSNNNDSVYSLEPLPQVFDCEALCVLTQEVDGKMIKGWTCAYCPYLNDGSFTFQKHVNG